MGYENTRLRSLREDCAKEFGEEKGAEIYAAASERLADMLRTADFLGSEKIKEHISENMYPAIAYYLTLLDRGYSRDEAYALTLKETKKSAEEARIKNEPIGRFPLAYPFLRMTVKGMMARDYPAEGWETEWVRRDRNEIHMNFRRCIYLERTTEFGCPELCTVFCKNDDVVLAGFAPRILFRRSGTLAEGAACCDFHFLRG